MSAFYKECQKIVSKGDVRELAFTGRIFDGEYAEKIRFVSKTYENFEDLFKAGVEQLKRLQATLQILCKEQNKFLIKVKI